MIDKDLALQNTNPMRSPLTYRGGVRAKLRVPFCLAYGFTPETENHPTLLLLRKVAALLPVLLSPKFPPSDAWNEASSESPKAQPRQQQSTQSKSYTFSFQKHRTSQTVALMVAKAAPKNESCVKTKKWLTNIH